MLSVKMDGKANGSLLLIGLQCRNENESTGDIF